jgi:hypothetical protein
MPLFDRLVLGFLGGLAGFVASLVAGALRALILVATGSAVTFDGVWPDLVYFASGCVAAGVFLGLLWPLRKYRFGSYAIGMLGLGGLTAMIIVTVSGSPWHWRHGEWLGLASMTILGGVTVGVALGRSTR